MAKQHEYLKGLPIKDYQNAHPTVLLGLNHSHLLVAMDKKTGNENEPIAIRTKLGWMIFGNISTSVEYEHVMMHDEEEEDLNAMMRRFESSENFGVKVVENLPRPADDIRAEKIFKDTLKYENGSYEVGLLWKDDEVKFPNNYGQALRRLQYLERKMSIDKGLKKWAIETFKEYEKKGYIRKLEIAELSENYPKLNYIPHFIVLNKNKVPPKPRLVFDAAAKYEGISLNSKLLSGPDTLTSLFGILLRFREGKFAVCGDIKEMFHQVKIRKEDQHAQRFLWRNCNSSEPPDQYVMQVMTFGATCSPYCAQAVKNHNAERYETEYPEATNAIIKQHYVDDYVDSFWDLDSAKELTRTVIRIHQTGGFHIRNFTSNSTELLKGIPTTRRAPLLIKPFEDKDSRIEKVLGVYWDTANDTLSYRINYDDKGIGMFNATKAPTKRQVLSLIMSIYDPLGLISNLIVHGKTLLQELHKFSKEWDTAVPDELCGQWLSFLDKLKQAENLSIPRCILVEYGPIQLHAFVDSSEKALAACVYARSESRYGIHIQLITAKTRVAPIKPISIPRLELQAAVMGTRLIETVKRELRLQIQSITLWSDSQTVLAWIKNTNKRYTPYINVRVGEILDTTAKDQWRWVPSEENPADEATKENVGKSKWYTGPRFLKQASDTWPLSRARHLTCEEEILFHGECDIIDENDFSDWWRLLKRYRFILKFVNQTREKRSNFTVADRRYIENILYRKAQWQAFPVEMEVLTNGNSVTRPSNLVKLNPFLDQFGVMRSNGRLARALGLPEQLRLPIILPQKHHVTRLIIRDAHERKWHQGNDTVIGALQQKYWILNVRAAVKNVKKCCQWRILAYAKPVNPMMAALPDCRTTPNVYPFTNTGVDYFGPFEVMVHRSMEKRWGVIFTCLSTRAVHIEMAEKLNTDSFLVYLTNFQSIRGRVNHLFSDNGTNFIGANNEMKKLIKNIDKRMDNGEAAKQEIQWTFNPPTASHFGGAWERLIRIIKGCLKVLFKSFPTKNPSPDTLRSALIQVSAILNKRPLTHIPIETIEDKVLTPFHFLILRSGEEVPPQEYNLTQYDREHWKQALKASTQFWNTWKTQYVATLCKRNKWTKLEDPLAVDDIVLITDDNAPPNTWLKGRIIEVYPGADKQVRSVKIQTAKGVLTRPSNKVAFLDVRNKAEDKNKASVMIHHQEPGPLNPPVASTSFSNWGKRKQIDIETVKKKAEELNSPRPSKRANSHRITTSPGAFARMVVTASALLSFTDALLVKPIEDDGLMFDHQGTCLVERGTWRTNIATNISISEDIYFIKYIHQKLLDTLQATENHSSTNSASQIARSIEHECDNAIDEILRSSRVKRSKGIFGFLKDLFFGSNDIEDTIEAIRVNEDTKIHHLSETIGKINEKTANMSSDLSGKVYWVLKGVDTLKHKYSQVEQESLHRRMLEAEMLAKQMISEILGKYRKIRLFPLTSEDLKTIRTNITRSLPNGYEILDHSTAIQYETRTLNDTIIITMKTTIIAKKTFELFHIIPIPHPKDKSLIIIDNHHIAVNEHGRYFYPMKELTLLSHPIDAGSAVSGRTRVRVAKVPPVRRSPHYSHYEVLPYTYEPPPRANCGPCSPPRA
ncbi:uncharacterized protein LOC128744438 [Sabethes cyaneus]|uniref:uncharacterized protein LOC128744438 n=1 Tax=Sabethes cyaneus TaxID=53552 RepID=UPI00237D7624|nr:uncharacterized protein LOC128744438 [Sabethes cyaneus]